MNGRRLVVNLLAVIVLAAGVPYALLGRPLRGDRPVPTFPELRTVIDTAGAPLVAVDHAALCAAFAAAGLPDPPGLDGADPVPAAKLVGYAVQWAGTGNVEALGRLGQVYQALEEHTAALGCFAAAGRLAPEDVRWCYGVGAECQALALDEPAIEALGRAAELDPDHTTTWARLGTLHLERGELDRAGECFARAAAGPPTQALGLVGLGRVALARGDAETARARFSAAVEASPRDYMAHRFLGRAYAALGRADLARRQQQIADRLPQYVGWLQFDRHLAEAHQLANTQRHLGNMLRLAAGGGHYERGVEIARELLRRRPNDWNTLANIARLYRALDRHDEAEHAIEQAIALRPDGVDLHHARAEILFSREAYPAADDVLERVLALDATHAGAWELRARIRHLQGRHDDAITAVRHALDLDPDRSSAYLVQALILDAQGRRADAVAVLQELLDRDPGNLQARRMLGQ